MAWAFTWGFWLTVAAGGLGLAVVIPVLRARIRGAAGAWFLALLLLEGINFATDGGAWLALDRHARLESGLHALANWTSVVLAPAYLLFIRAAVETRSTRWMRSRAGAWSIVTFALVYFAFATASVLGVLIALPAYVILALRLLNMAVYVFAIWIAVEAWTLADSDMARRQGVALLLAFGLRDIGWILNGLGLFDIWYAGGGAYEQALPVLYAVYGAIGIVYFPAVTYAVLSGRIVDVDHRFQVGLTKTTAAAIIATLFIVLSETVEALLPIDNTFISVAAAVLLAFLFQPVQALSQRFIARFFPERDDEEHAFYAAQCEIAWRDGDVTDKERAMLQDLAKRLGLDARTARTIEAPFQPKL